VCALLVLLGCGNLAALEVVDDSGQIVVLHHPAQRILALSPHAAELVFAAGAGDRLVGTVAHTDFPPPAAALPRVGDSARLNRELLLALQPDLVIAWTSGNRPQDLAWLQRQGIALYRSDPQRLESIADNLEDIGRLAGSRNRAALAAERFRNRLRYLKQRYRRKTPIRVFYQLWPNPLMSIDSTHIISEVFESCGGTNVVKGLAGPAGNVSREAVLGANPQAIFAPGASDSAADPFADWRKWPDVDAVAGDHLFIIPADLLQRPTPRILKGMERACRNLSEINPL
jgi:iron complex transport system substrate-binding protein